MPTISSAQFLTILRPWGTVAEPTYKRMGQILDVEATDEVLWIGTGSARSVMWWAERFRTHIAGLDPDSGAVEAAERSARHMGMAGQISFQVAPPSDLPYEQSVFDLVTINVLSLLGQDYEAILREAGRVVRPMKPVVALVPSWLREPDEADARLLADRMGLNPQLVVEWKRWFREAGIVELTVEDAPVTTAWMEVGWLVLLPRSWRGAGWRGIRFILSPEFRVLHRLVQQRALGLSIIKGTRWPNE